MIYCLGLLLFSTTVRVGFAQNLLTDSITISSDTTKTVDSTKADKTDTSIISKSAIRSIINYTAKDSIPIDLEHNMISLYGKAEISYEDIKLQAAIIRIDWKNSLIYAEGITDSLNRYVDAPVYTDKGQVYKTNKIIYNFKTRKAKIFGLITNEGESYIHGKEVKKDSNDVVYVKRAKYTTCVDHDPHFYISAAKIEIMEKQIITGPAYLVIEDVPMPLAIPFGFFPSKNKRSSGIILPAYGESNNRGFYLRGMGYYFGISDYFDLLIKGDIYSHGSWLVNLNTNYAKRYRYRGSINVNYAWNKFGDPETPEYSLSKDFNITWSHTQDPKARPNSSFSANVNAGSSNSYRNNFTNPQDILTNTLRSGISYSKTFAGTPFSLSGSISHSQNLYNRTLSLVAPDLNFSVSRIMPFKSKGIMKKRWYNNIGISYTMNFRNSLDTYDSLFLDAKTWDTWKNGFSHSIPLSTSFNILKYFTLSPQISYMGKTYFKRENKIWTGDTLITQEENGFYQLSEYNASVSLSTRIYGMYKINTLGLIAIRQVFTPRVSLTYRPDFGDPKYGYYYYVQKDTSGNQFRYSYYEKNIFGYPGAGEQGSMGFSLGTNIEAKIRVKNDTTGPGTRKVKILDNFNISGNYNFLADSMNLSSISFSGYTTLFKDKLNVQFSGNVDPYLMNSKGIRVNTFLISNNNGLFRLTNFNLSLNSSLGPKNKKKKKENDQEPVDYVDFNVPWDLSFSYSINYSKPAFEPMINQTLDLSGSLSLTAKWRIGFRTGYDFEHKEFTMTSIDIHRDLHCWEMSFSWIPYGYSQSYMFKINVKSAILKDLKIDKKKYYFDY